MITDLGEVACDACGLILEVGMHPFCPHGIGQNSRIHDDIPGGMVLENYGKDPITVYSHTERRAVMAKAGLELKERFCPMPGTDIDPAGIPNPKGYMDPVTMQNGIDLILRQQCTPLPPAFDPQTVIRRQFTVQGSEREARRFAEDPKIQRKIGRRIARALNPGS